MADSLYIDVYIASQKMLRLRIVGAAQHLLNKDMPAACRGKDPKKGAQ